MEHSSRLLLKKSFMKDKDKLIGLSPLTFLAIREFYGFVFCHVSDRVLKDPECPV